MGKHLKGGIVKSKQAINSFTKTIQELTDSNIVLTKSIESDQEGIDRRMKDVQIAQEQMSENVKVIEGIKSMLGNDQDWEPTKDIESKRKN